MRSMLAAVAFAALALTASSTASPAAAAAPPMSVATFLAKAEGLERKGPLALLSGDLKLLTGRVKQDFADIRQQRLADKAAGHPSFCPPEAAVKLTDKDVMAAMQAVPAAQRPRTDTRSALRAMLIRRYPCRA